MMTKAEMVKEMNNIKKMEKEVDNKMRMRSFYGKNTNTKGFKTQKTFSNKPKNMNRRTGR